MDNGNIFAKGNLYWAIGYVAVINFSKAFL